MGPLQTRTGVALYHGKEKWEISGVKRGDGGLRTADLSFACPMEKKRGLEKRVEESGELKKNHYKSRQNQKKGGGRGERTT